MAQFKFLSIALPFLRQRRTLSISEPPIRAEVFSLEQLEEHATALAHSDQLTTDARRSRRLLPRLNENREILTAAQQKFADAVRAGRAISPAAEWLLDNFYIVQDQLRQVDQDLSQRYYRELPKLANGSYAEYPRVYGLALELIAHTDSRLEAEVVTRFVQAYQRVAPLSIGELWAIPIMLRLGLIENVRRLMDQTMIAHQKREAADSWADRVLKMSNRPASQFVIAVADLLKSYKELDSTFTIHLLHRLRDQDASVAPTIRWLEQRLVEEGTTIEAMVRIENHRRATNRVSVGNAITSMRAISIIDWKEFFESTSFVEHVLQQDPSGAYTAMDFDTRDRYRHVIERLSKRTHLPEPDIASRALAYAHVGLSMTESDSEETEEPGEKLENQYSRIETSDVSAIRQHVGYYLIQDGLCELEADIGYRPRFGERLTAWALNHPTLVYLGAIGFLTGLLVLALLAYAFSFGVSGGMLALLVLVATVPVSALAISLVDRLITLKVPPKPLPKLEFKDDIPERYRTMVVVPVLINDAAGIRRLLDNLEIRYLANQDAHLHFALLSDFADAPAQSMPDDADLIDMAIQGIRRLNDTYGRGREDRFYLFHRRRLWNDRDRIWMGWERKRGKLVEFNRLLRGATNTNYSVQIGDLSILPRVKYLITLDADTELPTGSAKRLIGTIAHPLNRARPDPSNGCVTTGYGVVQPRTGVTALAASETQFAQIFAGETGLDPYTHAVSSVYQDLFGTGIYVGKAIYDVDVFHEVLDQKFPENWLLSHDLLEGAHVRAGLATDIQLLEDFPSGYDAFVQRQHRWVRGDWQITNWLFSHVPDASGRRVRNPLPLIERWKILDNLRRSLVPLTVVMLLVAGWTVLPGSPWFWTTMALLAIIFPLFMNLASSVSTNPPGEPWQSYLWAVGQEAALDGARALLLVTFILCWTVFNADAILRVLVRRAITRRNLLEWNRADAVQQTQARTLADFWARLWRGPALAIGLLILVMVVAPTSLVAAVPILLLWSISPFVAYFVSQRREASQKPLPEEAQRELRLIARRIWSFFETFVGPDDHWLPPDNYQEIPNGIVAHRTSPTNISFLFMSTLAAYDFGYIGTIELADRLERTLSTLEQLERYRGHFFNWYDTTNLQPLAPEYVSTVDSGNLAAGLIVLKQACLEMAQAPDGAPEALPGLKDTTAALQAALKELDHKPTHASELVELITIEVKKISSRLGEAGDEGTGWFQLNDQLDRSATLISQRAQLLERGASAGTLTDVKLWADRLAQQIQVYRTALEAVEDDQHLTSRYLSLAQRAEALIEAMDFSFLFDERRGIFSIGYNVAIKRLDNSYYDLLASEARLASFVAIARGQVPEEHWFRLGRPLTRAGSKIAVLSWGGTMFEYLMPSLLMRDVDQTLLSQTYEAVIQRQIEYGTRRRIPWGISESGFYAFDYQQNYQYRMFGVPDLSLKREVVDNLVVAPYATFLALPVAAQAAWENLQRLMKEGVAHGYGFYEALDYTPSRRPKGQRVGIVRSFMAHHQGMSLVALDNFLNDFPMQRRFHAEPSIAAIQLLLQERLPVHTPLVQPQSEERQYVAGISELQELSARPITTPHTPMPRAHFLSNGAYTVMVTNAGGGYSVYQNLAVTRWRQDITRDDAGTFCYVKDLASNKVWSTAYQPVLQEPENYEVTYSQDKAEFHRRDNGIETQTEIVVSPQNNAEIRRVSLTNHSRKLRHLELTSYAEVVLATPQADAMHPAFGKLFIETEFMPTRNALLFKRRPRSADQAPIWAVHLLAIEGQTVGEVQYETDRARFLGRGRTPAEPEAIDRPLSGTVGAVLDPIMSLRCRVRVRPGETVRVSFMTGVAGTYDGVIALCHEYCDPRATERTLDLAWAQGQVELRHLNVSADQAHLFQRLASHLLYSDPALRAPADVLRRNVKGQSGLWPYGISGDYPILLVQVHQAEELSLVREALLAHEFWRLNNFIVDLVILNEQPTTYADDFHGQIQGLIDTSLSRPYIDKPGGIFLRRGDHIADEDKVLLQTVARVVLDGDLGGLADQLKRSLSIGTTKMGRPAEVRTGRKVPASSILPFSPSASSASLFFNGLGGFTSDGREYVISLGKGQWTPSPWINVLANPQFGCLVSEAGFGCTWSENSQSNRLTPWSNDPVSDRPGEAVYLCDEDTGDLWSPTPLPIREDEPYVIRHGAGYTVFEHSSHGIAQELLVFVPKDDPVKVLRLKLRNISGQVRHLSATYFAEWVLGVTREQGQHFTVTEMDPDTGALLARNTYNTEFSHRVAFADVNQYHKSVTADRTAFLGRNGSPARPAALDRAGLSGRVEAGSDPCAAVQARLRLGPGQEKEMVFLLGQGNDKEQAHAIIHSYRDPVSVQAALDTVTAHWDEVLGTIQVKTPDSDMDLLLNRWLLYQVLVCRVWARSAFYQSSGAYGFRDQLQDVMALVWAAPELAREQILRAAARQFAEGDVQHWWHLPSGQGVRTRCSDDYLWLPFVTHYYVTTTGDESILDKVIPFLKAPLLSADQHEAFVLPTISSQSASLYEHCVCALDYGLTFGEHGLPLIGTGDWNDGMNGVGLQGKGESVWVGWFLHTNLVEFAHLAESRGDDRRASNYRHQAQQLEHALQEHAWDGAWYRRAYFDDGTPLGSAQNDECKIDSIAQSWATISGAAPPERAQTAMESLAKFLIRERDGLILLLTPSFDTFTPDPGYIKGYVPGIRENGGQYTHAALWVVLAYALKGEGDRAAALFRMLNPINHARTPDEVARYKVEPYVVAADVYSEAPHVGRGGWTWYTGSASWMYRVGVESILGFKLQGDSFTLTPCIPREWSSYQLTYSHGATRYEIVVENPHGVNAGVERIILDGIELSTPDIPLSDDQQAHYVQIVLGLPSKSEER